MVNDELKAYIQKSFTNGKSVKEIEQALLDAGWQEADIREALRDLETVKQSPSTPSQTSQTQEKIGTKTALTYSIFLCAIVILGGVIFYLWQDRLDLGDTNAQKVREFYTRLSQSQISFTDTGDMVFPDEQKFITQKNQNIQEKKDFIEANLRTMAITLYESGVATKTVEIISKNQ